MSRFKVTAALTVAVVVSMASSAWAQFGGRGFQIPVSAQNIMLLNGEAVQKELALSPDQTKSITDLARQMQADAMEIFSGLQDLTPEERQKEMPSLMTMVAEKGKELQKKVDTLLDAKQQGRLRELSLQRRGVAALDDEEVIGALKLTDEQKEKLLAIREEAGKQSQELVQSVLSGGGDRSQIRGKMQTLQKEFGEKALATLSPEQREQFDKMKGSKFEFPPQRGFGF